MEQSDNKGDWVDLLKALLIALILALIVRTFIFSAIIVDGPSMLPTLQDRDQMIVNRMTYRFKDVERFDIIVFHATYEKDFIKRVIGLPGEHVKVEKGILYINGEPVEEPFLEDDSESSHSSILTPDFTLEKLPGAYEEIPEDHYFVLGDNRYNSTDSRALGVIHEEQIVGKTSLIYWPIKRIKWMKH